MSRARFKHRHTFLDEFEAIANVTLICHKEQSAVLLGIALTIRFLSSGNFRSEGNATPDDATDFSTAKTVQVCSGVGLADVCCEGASVLRFLIIREYMVEAEIVVACRISAEFDVVFSRCDIDRCSFVTLVHNSGQVSLKGKITYHSSNVRQGEHQADPRLPLEVDPRNRF